MATLTYDDIALGADWTELTSEEASLVDADCVVQNVDPGNGTIDVVFGGGSAPTNKTGFRLWYGDSVQGNASNIWARANDGSGLASASTV